MIILVDAYNVLKSLYGAEVSDQQCDQYRIKLKRYAKKKNHTIIFIFDGGYSDWPSQEKYGNLRIIFSGYKQTADDLIKRYLEDNKNKDILLVSADRELIDYAYRFDIISIAPMLFEQYVTFALEKKSSTVSWARQEPQKLRDNESNEELDALMEQASMKIMHKNDESQIRKISRKPQALKISKKDRKLSAQLKKL